QNYFDPIPRGPTWSLAVEEHFYLAVPLLLLLFMLPGLRGRDGSPRGVPILVGLIAIASLVGRLLTSRIQPYYEHVHYYPTHLRTDGRAFGVLLAYVKAFRPRYWTQLGRHKILAALVGLALLSPMALLTLHVSPFVTTYGFSLLYLGWSAILIA